MSPAEALSLLREVTPVLPSEEIPLGEAVGRVLARPFIAPHHLPAFARAAMDGFAVRAQEVAGASSARPRALRVQGNISAGEVAPEPLQPGSAYVVATGAALPPGADAVVRQEVTALSDDGRQVLVARAVAAGHDVVPEGADFRRGRGVLPAGWVLGANDVGLLAAFGVTRVSVVRRPRVAYVETGSELMEPGTPLRPGCIYGSNGVALAARALQHGADVVALRRVGDDRAELEACFRELLEQADVVVSTGGVSVGPRDWVPATMEALGFRFLFRGLRIRPGRPVTAGLREPEPGEGRTPGAKLWLALPGNPAAALINHELFVRPVLWRMSGLLFAQGFNPALSVPVDGEPPEPAGRPRFFLAHLRAVGGQWRARLEVKSKATGFAAPFVFNALAEGKLRGSRVAARAALARQGGADPALTHQSPAADGAPSSSTDGRPPEDAGQVTVYPADRAQAGSFFIPFPWEVGGVLLAGGASRRMGHSKLLLPVEGVPLVVRAYRALRAVCAQVRVVGAPPETVDQLALWEGEEVRDDVVPDRWPGEGPLGGLITGLEATPQPVALCLAADWVGLDEGALRHFLEAVHGRLADGSLWSGSWAQPPDPVFVLTGEDGSPQPLAALYPVIRTLAEARRLWEAGGRKVRDVFPALGVVGIPVPASFVNVNTPEEYRRALAGGGGDLGERQQWRPPVVLAFSGHSGSGKTTLMTRLIKALTERGIKVAAIKHGHRFDLDPPGKDSWLLRAAGAEPVVLVSSRETVTFSSPSSPPSVESLLEGMAGAAPVVLVEGFKKSPWPKVLVLRDDETYASHPLAGDPTVQAVYGGRSGEGAPVPWFPRAPESDDPALAWLLNWVFRALGRPPA